MSNIKTETYELPAHWASYLINDDASGLDDGEQEAIDLWMNHNITGTCVDVSEDSWFARRSDFSSLGGTVATFTFLVQ